MASDTYEQGDIVAAEYKTGLYIGEIVEADSMKAKVRIAAVMKHPEQGNLHEGHRADVAMFHQRRALAFREVANVPMSRVKRYDGIVPDYRTSLETAVARELEALEEHINWAQQSKLLLEELKKEYRQQPV